MDLPSDSIGQFLQIENLCFIDIIDPIAGFAMAGDRWASYFFV